MAKSKRFTRDQAVEIWERQEWVCADCGIGVGNYDEVHMPHHIKLRSQQGTNDIDNGVGLCPRCHSLRHGIKEAPMK